MKHVQIKHDLAIVYYNVLSHDQQANVLKSLRIRRQDEAQLFQISTRAWAIAIEEELELDK